MVAPSANHGSACGGCATRAAAGPVTHGGTALQSSGNGHTPAVPLTISASRAPAAQSPPQSNSPIPSPQLATASRLRRPLAPSPSPRFNPHAFAGTGTPDPAAPFPRPAPPPPSHVFNPEPELWHEVLRALSDPYQSLDDAAAAFNTTLTALTAWMARPEIEAELDNFERQGARKARLAAVAELPKTVIALSSILDSYSYQERKVPVAPNTEAKEQRRRHGESSRKAAWLIYRIARFYAGPPAPPTARRVQAQPAKDGTPITTPALSALPLPTSDFALPASFPPLDTVADVLQSILAHAAANRAAAPNGTSPADTAPGDTPIRAMSPDTPSPNPSPVSLEPAPHSVTRLAESLRHSPRRVTSSNGILPVSPPAPSTKAPSGSNSDHVTRRGESLSHAATSPASATPTLKGESG